MGAGEYFGHFSPKGSDYIIAADGGMDTLNELGIEPHLIIGDFDSSLSSPSGNNVIILPKEKDDTDTLAALRIGIDRGFDEFHIFGGMGGRADHTLANIHCLSFLCERNCRGYLYGNGMIITALKNGQMKFDSDILGYLSVFAYGGKAENVSLRGLKYPLENACLTCDMPLGVSNEFIGESAEISVGNGTLLICYPINQKTL